MSLWQLSPTDEQYERSQGVAESYRLRDTLDKHAQEFQAQLTAYHELEAQRLLTGLNRATEWLGGAAPPQEGMGAPASAEFGASAQPTPPGPSTAPPTPAPSMPTAVPPAQALPRPALAVPVPQEPQASPPSPPPVAAPVPTGMTFGEPTPPEPLKGLEQAPLVGGVVQGAENVVRTLPELAPGGPAWQTRTPDEYQAAFTRETAPTPENVERIIQESTGIVSAGPQAAGGLFSAGKAALQPIRTPQTAAETLDLILGGVREGREPAAPTTAIEQAIGSFMTRMGAAWVDRGAPLEAAQREVYKALGRAPTEAENAYALYRLYAGIRPATAMRIAEDVTPALEGLTNQEFRYLNAALAAGDNLDKGAAVARHVTAAALEKPAPAPPQALVDAAEKAAQARDAARQTFDDLSNRLQTVLQGPDTRAQRLLSGRVRGAQAVLSRAEQALLQTRNTLDTEAAQRVALHAATAAQAGATAEGARAFAGGAQLQPLPAIWQEVESRLGPESTQRVQTAAQAIWDFNSTVRKELLDSQVLTPEGYAWFEQHFPHYARARLVDHLPDTSGSAAFSAGPSFSVADAGIKQITEEGSTAAREKPVSSLIGEWFRAFAVAQRNRVALGIKALVDDSPELRGLVHVMKSGESLTADEARFSFLAQGKPITWVVPKTIEPMFKMDPQIASRTLRGISQAMGTPLFRFTATVGNPLFVSQHGIRRAMSYMDQAPVLFRTDPFTAAAYLARAYVDSVAHFAFGRALPADWVDAVKLGAAQSGSGLEGAMGRTSSDVQRALQGGPLGGAIRRVETKADWLGLLKDVLTLPFTATTRATEAVDVPQHMAAYRLAQRAGFGPQTSALAARDVPLDLARSGGAPAAQFLRAVVPFFNIPLQTAARMRQQYRDDPVRSVANATALFTLPAVAAELWNRWYAPNDYADVRDSLKDRGFVVMTPLVHVDRTGHDRHVPFFVPLDPREALLVGAARVAVSLWAHDNPRELGTMAAQFFGGMLPGELGPERGISGLIPPTIRAAAAQITNRREPFSPVNTQPIVNPRDLPMPPAAQVQPSTSAAAMALGRATGISPARIQTGAEQFVPGVARVVGPGSNQVARALGLPSAAAEQAPGAAPLNVPVVGGLLGGVLKPQYGQEQETARNTLDDQQRAMTAARLVRIEASPSFQRAKPEDQQRLRRLAAAEVAAYFDERRAVLNAQVRVGVSVHAPAR